MSGAAPQHSNYLAGLPSLPELLGGDPLDGDEDPVDQQRHMQWLKDEIRKRRTAHERWTGQLVEVEPPYGFVELRRG